MVCSNSRRDVIARRMIGQLTIQVKLVCIDHFETAESACR